MMKQEEIKLPKLFHIHLEISHFSLCYLLQDKQICLKMIQVTFWGYPTLQVLIVNILLDKYRFPRKL